MQPLALRPEDAAKTIGRSRGRIYELIASGELRSFKDGTSRLIAVEDLRAWVENRRGGSGNSAPAGAGQSAVSA